MAEGAAAASRRNGFDPISPDVSVPDVETAEIALYVDAGLTGSVVSP